MRLAALSTALAVLVGPTAAAAAAPTPDPQLVCATAKRLVADALPQRAVVLVEAARATDPSYCGVILRDAVDQVEEAASKAEAADALLTQEEWEQAAEKADQALSANRENTRAQAVKAAAEARSAAAKTGPQKRFELWKNFREVYVDPISGLLVPMLVVLLGLLLAARLATSLTVRWPRLDGARRFGVLAVGLALSTYIAFFSTVVMAAGLPLSDTLSLAGLGLVAVTLVAWALATRLRLMVTVIGEDGNEKPAATGHVVALLSELGAESPKGLEVPQGADVQALDGAFNILPDRAVLKAASAMFQGLVGLTPWRVRVTEEREGLLSVQITRNGRSAGSAVIDADVLGLRLARPRRGRAKEQTGSDPGAGEKEEVLDLHRLAAAVVVTTLAPRHNGFDGLCGATDWRGVGLHYIATTDLSETALEEETLARAVDFDPKNLSAQVAWRYAMCREATEPGAIRAYVEWLSDYLPVPGTKGQGALRQRMLHSRAAAAINYYYATQRHFAGLTLGRRSDAKGVLAATKVIDELVRELEGDATTGGALREAARPAAAAMATWAKEVPRLPLEAKDELLDEWLESPAGPLGHYNLGCYYATGANHRWSKGLHHLQLAAEVPELRRWLKKDPQLERVLRDRADYRAALIDPPASELLSLQTLEPFADKLRKAGAGDLVSLRRYLGSPLALPLVLGWDFTVARQILLTIALADSVPGELGDFRVELCRELIERDQLGLVGNTAAAIPRELAGEIEKAIIARCLTGPSVNQIDGWLHSVRDVDGFQGLRARTGVSGS